MSTSITRLLALVATVLVGVSVAAPAAAEFTAPCPLGGGVQCPDGFEWDWDLPRPPTT